MMKFRFIWLLVAVFVASNLCFATPELVESQKTTLLDKVSLIMVSRLQRYVKSVRYSGALANWKIAESELRIKEFESLADFEKDLKTKLKNLGLSHFGFEKIAASTDANSSNADANLSSSTGNAKQEPAREKGPSYREFSRRGVAFTYLKVPDFYWNYDPNQIQIGMDHAARTGRLIVDLRGNIGGRADHFFGYFLAPKTPFWICSRSAKRESIAREEVRKILDALWGDISLRVFKVNPVFQQSDAIYLDPKYVKAHAFQYFKSRSSFGVADSIMTGVRRSFESLYQDLSQPAKQELDSILKFNLELLRKITSELYYEKANAQSLRLKYSKAYIHHVKRLRGWERSFQARLKGFFESHKSYYVQGVPSSYESYGLWKALPTTYPTPYLGKMVLLIDIGTFCAAENFVAVLTEYQKLRQQQKIWKHTYQDQLYPEWVKVIGHSGGLFQIQDEEEIQTDFGNYKLKFPRSDPKTPVYNRVIEGSGIHGLDPSFSKAAKKTVDPENANLEPVLEDAMELLQESED